MKKLNALFVVFALFLWSISLSGQGNFEADPFNYLNVAQKIVDDYPYSATISLTQIENHLYNTVRGATYSPGCGKTPVVNSSAGLADIDLSWDPTSGVSKYEVKYLNLGDGSTGTKIEYGTSTTFSNLPDGTYLFSVISFCGSEFVFTTSAVNLIIIEKLVLLIDPGQGNCECKNPIELFSEWELNGTDQVIVDISPVLGFEYNLIIHYTQSPLTSSANYQAVTNPITLSYPISYSVDCLGNFGGHPIYVNDNTLYADYHNPEVGPTLAHVNSSNHYWEISNKESKIEGVVLNLCLNTLEHSSKSEGDLFPSGLSVSPNPVKDVVDIKTGSSLDNPGQIKIMNSIGHIVYQMDASRPNVALNLSGWAKGMYYIFFTHNEKVSFSNFVKVD